MVLIFINFEDVIQCQMVSFEYLPYQWVFSQNICSLYILGVGKFFHMLLFVLWHSSRSHDQIIHPLVTATQQKLLCVHFNLANPVWSDLGSCWTKIEKYIQFYTRLQWESSNSSEHLGPYNVLGGNQKPRAESYWKHSIIDAYTPQPGETVFNTMRYRSSEIVQRSGYFQSSVSFINVQIMFK